MLKRILLITLLVSFAFLTCACEGLDELSSAVIDTIAQAETGSDSNSAAVDASAQTETGTCLNSPFHGDGSWYLTQAFGAYYNEPSLNIAGHHTGEDWNYAAGDGDAGQPVYAIAPGTVVGSGPVFSNDPEGTTGGFYLVVKHEGQFTIPGSEGAHIQASSAPQHEAGRASNNGKAMLLASDVFTSEPLTDYSLGETDLQGAYSYPALAQPVTVLYSVYLHIQDPSEYIAALDDDRITEEMLDEPIGYLMGGMSAFSSHLHFEIRVGDNAGITKSALSGNVNGYFTNSQDMISVGYREPSSIIQANMRGDAASGATAQVQGASAMQGSAYENGTFLISLRPDAEEPDDFAWCCTDSDSYVISETNGGYLLTCYVFDCFTVSYDEYCRMAAGETIDTPAGQIGQPQCVGEYNDYLLEEGAVIFNEGEYCINRIPEAGSPEILRYTWPEIWSNSRDMEYCPVILSSEKQVFFISDDAAVSLYDYGYASAVSFHDYLAGGNDFMGDPVWNYTFYATVQNNEIIALEEVLAFRDDCA